MNSDQAHTQISSENDLGHYPELPRFNFVDYLPFLFFKNSRKLSNRENAEIFRVLSEIGFRWAMGTYVLSTLFFTFLYLLSLHTNPNISSKEWFIWHGLLIVACISSSYYSIKKRAKKQFNYAVLLHSQIFVSIFGGFAWGGTSGLLSNSSNIFSELSLTIIGPIIIITALWLASCPIAFLVWVSTALINFFIVEHNRSDFAFIYSIIVALSLSSFAFCLFLFITRIRHTLDKINVVNQQTMTRTLLKKFEQNSSDFLWQTDSNGLLMYGSQYLMELCSKRGASTGVHFASLFNANQKRGEQLDSKIMSTKSISMIQVGAVIGDYTEWWSISGEPLHDNSGEQIGFSGFATNITALKRMEASQHREQSYAIVTQMASTIAHDFNNYLATISGNLELIELSNTPVNKSISSFKNNAARAVRDAAFLTRQLLLLGKNDILMPESVRLHDTLHIVRNDVHAIYPENLHIACHSNEEDELFVDKRQLERALRNIVENAAQAMNGEGQISITTERHLHNSPKISHLFIRGTQAIFEEYIVISIADDGPGFEPELIEIAFQPFVTTRRKTGGTGIGLAMVNGFCQQSNGTVVIRNTKNGAVVELVLPSSRQPKKLAKSEISMDFSHLHGKHVLLLEDEQTLSQATCAMLEHHKMHVICAESLAQARKHLLQTASCDFLIADLILPDGYGHELTHDIKKQFPNIKTVFVTGYIQPVELKRSGVHSPVLLKPVNIQSLLNTMSGLLTETELS